MNTNKVKSVLLNLIGILATTVVIAAVSWLLFLMGYIRSLSTEFWTELGIVTILMIIMRIFWYTQTEFKILTSSEFEETQQTVKEAISSEVIDTEHFDKCIDYLNELNYKTKYVNLTNNITVNNYRVTFKNKLSNIFRRTKWTVLEFYNDFLKRMERRAAKVHKLSSSRILTMSESELIDDRNNTKAFKTKYIVTGTVLTVLFVATIAIVGFTKKDAAPDAILKLCIYIASILFTIAQTILTVQVATKTNYVAYFNKLLTIIDRYKQYKKTNPIGDNYDRSELKIEPEQIIS